MLLNEKDIKEYFPINWLKANKTQTTKDQANFNILRMKGSISKGVGQITNIILN